MPTLDIEGFSGIVPRMGASRLPVANAQVALNVKLQSGELHPWRLPVSVYSPQTPSVQGIYNLVGPAGATQWLEFPFDVDVVGSPMADVTDFRVYYTGATIEPRKTNWALALSGGTAVKPGAYYEMGVPGPTVAPTLTASSSSGVAEARAYIYTYVNQFGAVQEESAPSPATVVTVTSSGATVTVAGFAAPPTGFYNYRFINIYRSVTGTQTVSYQFVAQIAIGTASYVDSLVVTQLGAQLVSLNYTPPPATLIGIVEMPNGMLAGFTGNQVWFCEPYAPHAWPVNYMMTVEFPIVGLGVFGNTLFIGTTKNPYLITGTTPLAMSQEKLPIIQACVSKRSIVSDQWGVVYASPSGLLAIGPGVQDIVTQQLYTRDEWSPLNPSTLVGILYNNMYIGFYNNGLGPITAFCFLRGDNPPLTLYNFDATCVFVERSTGSVYACSQATNQIYRLDADPVNNTVFQWRSKLYVLPEPTNYSAFKVNADWTYVADPVAYNALVAQIEAANQVLWTAAGAGTLGGCINDTQLNVYQVDGSILQSIPQQENTRYVNVIIFGDGVQVFQGAATSNTPIRLPALEKCDTWEVLITGNAPVRKFTMATSIGELKTV